jgi:PKHD-type hydroxylase
MTKTTSGGTIVTDFAFPSPVDEKPNTTVCDAFTIPEVFSSVECSEIIDHGLAGVVMKGLGTKGGKDKRVWSRNCGISWVSRAGSTEWVFDRLDKVLTVIGSRVYGFSLAPSHTFQFTIYKKFQFYNWHFDNGAAGDVRKVAMVINLCKPDSYLGGSLKIKAHKWHDKSMAREQGSATLFPCYLLHKACPVWWGTRYSLVVWATGPNNGGLK